MVGLLSDLPEKSIGGFSGTHILFFLIETSPSG